VREFFSLRSLSTPSRADRSFSGITPSTRGCCELPTHIFYLLLFSLNGPIFFSFLILSSLANARFQSKKRFDENYGLARTQSLKNKDIPEGGAKGTILPSLGAPSRLCFEKYVDVSGRSIFPSFGVHFLSIFKSILDLLIPGKTPGIKERLVDLYGKNEMLFFGPDGMAFYVDEFKN
jgi:hypothetical protein